MAGHAACKHWRHGSTDQPQLQFAPTAPPAKLLRPQGRLDGKTRHDSGLLAHRARDARGTCAGPPQGSAWFREPPHVQF